MIDVAVIGGGFTGAAVAFHLARRGRPDLRVSVYEPREALGQGLAYSTMDPSHRINVPSASMSLLPDDEQHFDRWLVRRPEFAEDQAASLPDGRRFPARALFGLYVGEALAPHLRSGAVVHRRTRVTGVERTDRRWRVTDEAGAIRDADVLVIAASHPPPSPPEPLARALAKDPRFVANPWTPGALDRIGPRDRVLIVGSGLTMADVIATLDARGCHGPILAISRRGQRSRGHAPTPVGREGDFLAPPSTSALALLRRVRRGVRAAAVEGRSWHGLFDTLRFQGAGVWRALPQLERERLVRHLRPYWDTHRYRIAPQIEGLLSRRLRAGGLQIIAGRVQSAMPYDDRIDVSIRERGGVLRLDAFDAVVATTGPAHARILDTSPFLAKLAAQGLVEPDSIGLGLAVDERSRPKGRWGSIDDAFVAGPLARGEFGELMGQPEVAHHASFVAGEVLQRFPVQAACDRPPAASNA